MPLCQEVWTQLEAARRMGVTRVWLGKVERRETRLDVCQLIGLCRAYGIDLCGVMRLLCTRPEGRKPR
jgi:transcriptional regulator with XRE-family HTH domain